VGAHCRLRAKTGEAVREGGKSRIELGPQLQSIREPRRGRKLLGANLLKNIWAEMCLGIDVLGGGL